MTARKKKGGAKAPPTPDRVAAVLAKHRRWPADRETIEKIANTLRRFSGPQAWAEWREWWKGRDAPHRALNLDIQHHAKALAEALDKTAERAIGPDPEIGFHFPMDQIGLIAPRICRDLREIADLADKDLRSVEPWHVIACRLWEQVCAAWFIGRYEAGEPLDEDLWLYGPWREGDIPDAEWRLIGPWREGEPIGEEVCVIGRRWQRAEAFDEDAWRIGKGDKSPAVLAVRDILKLSGLHKSAFTISTRALRDGGVGDPFALLYARIERNHRLAKKMPDDGAPEAPVATPEHKDEGAIDED